MSLFVFAAIALLFAGAATAAPRPDQVLVVVNRAAAESREIGEFYARKREIPARNVCFLNTSAQEEIFRHVFDREVARPVADCLKSRGLTEQILYVATTLGVPLKISGSDGKDGDCASVDSELAMLYGTIHGKKYSPAGPEVNPFYGQRDTRFEHPRFPMYLVTRLAAYSVEDVKAMIDRAAQARNRGRVVLDLNGPDDGEGNNWLRTAALLLPAARTLLDENAQPVYEAKEVIGYASWGSNDKNRKRRFGGFQWLPGAITVEYVSTDGRTFRKPPDQWTYSTWSAADRRLWWEGSPQGLSADLILQGATGSSGHVYEPYLHACPRPEHLFPAYLGGRTLAESYYLSIPFLSWQNIVLGDPLCVLR